MNLNAFGIFLATSVSQVIMYVPIILPRPLVKAPWDATGILATLPVSRFSMVPVVTLTAMNLNV